MTALILPEQPRESPRLSLLVVPQAGGGAAMASGPRKAVFDGWLVAGTSFGGRETRFIDPLPADRGEMVGDVVEAALELAGMGAPVVLVGQCSGALIGYLAAASSPSWSDTANTTNPGRPNIAAAALRSRSTWGLSFSVS